MYIVVKRIPHTASNKVDRKALAEYYASMDISTWEEALAKDHGRLEDESWSPLATTIRDAVADLTGTPAERIKKTTPLSALGVDSVRSALHCCRRSSFRCRFVRFNSHRNCARLAPRFPSATSCPILQSSVS